MDTIQQFIYMGWHTIPHTISTITRGENGKKFKVPRGWQKYKEEFNEVPTAVGSVIPGSQSNLIVIDCDSTIATELMESMLPSYKAVTYSIGKLNKDKEEVRGSNWFFYYTPNVPVIHNGLYGLEVFSGDGDTQQVFLPTQGNKTKTHWESIPEMMDIPPHINTLLGVWARASKPQIVQHTNSNAASGQHTFNLAPLIEKQLTREDILPQLFSIITPSALRNDLYRKQGYLHPNDIEDGQGNDYMIRVSAIIGSDNSVSKELFTRIMEYINSQWEHPYSSKELKQRIDRMTSGVSRINNTPIWRYDKDWEHARFMDHNKVDELVEYFLDPSLLEIVEVNHTSLTTRVLTKNVGAAINLLTTKGDGLKGKSKVDIFQKVLPAMTKVVRPDQPFGPLADNRFQYNSFRPSPALEVIHNPDIHKDQYKEPTAFIKYMESLVPKESERTYLLRHLVTKMKTFKYSPAVYYFVGVPGSGKGLFTTLISKLMGGDQYVGLNLGSSEIIGVTNGWLEGMFFAHFDELHDTLGKYEDKKKANGNIKKWSGADTFQLRKMRHDPVPSDMLATFILTQNGSAFNMDIGDRRYLYMYTPNVLDMTLAEEFVDERDHKILDIAYYLQNIYEELPMREYLKPPMTDEKTATIMAHQPKELVILNSIETGNYDRLYELAVDSGIEMQLLIEHRSKDLIYQEALIWMYKGLTDTTKSDGEILQLYKAAIKHGQLKGQPSGQKMYHNNKWTITAPGFSATCEPQQNIVEPKNDGLDNIET